MLQTTLLTLRQRARTFEELRAFHYELHNFDNPVYSPLGATELRLVEILPGGFDDPIELRVRTIDLRDESTFDALSYVWHPRDGTIDPCKPPKPAFITYHGSSQILIGANLDSAIRHLQFAPDEKDCTKPTCTLWIDALCINQSVATERNHQVGLMKTIYSSAQHVLIWLGPSRYCSDLVLEALMSGQLETCDVAGFMTCLELLLQRFWFGRVWVAQELTLALECPIVHLGHKSCTWGEFGLRLGLVHQRLCKDTNILGTGDDHNLNCLKEDNMS